MKRIQNEVKIMDMLDDCVSQFFMLEGTNSKEKDEFVEFIRQAQKTLALISFRNLEKAMENEESETCSNCKEHRIIGKGLMWCYRNNVYTKGDRHCNDYIRTEEEE